MPTAHCEFCNWTEEIKHYEINGDAEEAVIGAMAGHVDRNHAAEYDDIRDGFTVES